MTAFKTGPKAFLTPAPRPREESVADQFFNYRARGTVRYAYQILINLGMADFVTSIVYDGISHSQVVLRVPTQHVEWVKRTLGIPD